MLDKIKKWARVGVKKNATKAFETSPGGELRGAQYRDFFDLNIVDEIKKVPGLKYKTYHTEGYYDHYYVEVSDHVGEIIELYLGLEDGFADMALADFIRRTMSEDETPAKV